MKKYNCDFFKLIYLIKKQNIKKISDKCPKNSIFLLKIYSKIKLKFKFYFKYIISFLKN
jgi:hypothetical protein